MKLLALAILLAFIPTVDPATVLPVVTSDSLPTVARAGVAGAADLRVLRVVGPPVSIPAPLTAGQGQVLTEGLEHKDGSRVAVAPAQLSGRIGRAVAGIRGTASWYCGNGSPCTHGYGPGLYAAAGSELRQMIGKGWRYSVVHVCSAGGCVAVQLVDTCACKGRRIIDLYRYAFKRIASPSAGVVGVRITAFLPKLPATDTK